MNFDIDIDDMLNGLFYQGQADELYTASIRTFWPGYESWDEEQTNEYHNRLSKIDANVTPDFASVADQQAEVRRIQRSAYAKKHWPKFYAAPEVRVVPNAADKQFDAWTQGEALVGSTEVRNVELHLPTGAWGRSRAVLLHELAHAVEQYEATEPYSRSMDYFDDGHGAKFAKRNIEVVRQFYSEDMANKLEANFRAEGVKIAS